MKKPHKVEPRKTAQRSRRSPDARRGATRKAPRRSHRPVPEKTLYERLGGVYAIAAVVDALIDRVMTNARLNANPLVDEAHHRVSAAGFKYLVTEQVCAASGGPQRYSGRSMHDSHAHLSITPAEWDAFIDDVRQTLAQFAVPLNEQRQLLAIVDSTRGDIVR